MIGTEWKAVAAESDAADALRAAVDDELAKHEGEWTEVEYRADGTARIAVMTWTGLVGRVIEVTA